MKVFSNDGPDPVDIAYTDAEGNEGVIHLGPGAVVQVDDTDPDASALVAAYAASLVEKG